MQQQQQSTNVSTGLLPLLADCTETSAIPRVREEPRSQPEKQQQQPNNNDSLSYDSVVEAKNWNLIDLVRECDRTYKKFVRSDGSTCDRLDLFLARIEPRLGGLPPLVREFVLNDIAYYDCISLWDYAHLGLVLDMYVTRLLWQFKIETRKWMQQWGDLESSEMDYYNNAAGQDARRITRAVMCKVMKLTLFEDVVRLKKVKPDMKGRTKPSRIKDTGTKSG
ncbi:hypothetical protein V1514DRAFT_344520 [Lipomyces japonicus]|uniref:uncharacterized protein n=1 Tax=Lipomyces japonicus TaxID=56871 RepID=UPI0034CEF1DE